MLFNERHTKVASKVVEGIHIYTGIYKDKDKERVEELLLSFDVRDVAHPPPCLSIVPSMEEARSASVATMILELHVVLFRPPSLPPCLACC
jgi:hypothetical protein